MYRRSAFSNFARKTSRTGGHPSTFIIAVDRDSEAMQLKLDELIRAEAGEIREAQSKLFS